MRRIMYSCTVQETWPHHQAVSTNGEGAGESVRGGIGERVCADEGMTEGQGGFAPQK